MVFCQSCAEDEEEEEEEGKEKTFEVLFFKLRSDLAVAVGGNDASVCLQTGEGDGKAEDLVSAG